MTEKRFNLVDLLETLAIADGDECKYYQTCNDDFMSLCNLLNELHNENEQLKQSASKMIGYFERAKYAIKVEEWEGYKELLGLVE